MKSYQCEDQKSSHLGIDLSSFELSANVCVT